MTVVLIEAPDYKIYLNYLYTKVIYLEGFSFVGEEIYNEDRWLYLSSQNDEMVMIELNVKDIVV